MIRGEREILCNILDLMWILSNLQKLHGRKIQEKQFCSLKLAKNITRAASDQVL